MDGHGFRVICACAFLGVLLSSCQKKTVPGEKRLAPQEAAGPAVALPEAGWTKSVAILNRGDGSPAANALFGEFAADMAGRLAAERTIRVTVRASDPPGRDTDLSADRVPRERATIECRIIARGSGAARWSIRLAGAGARQPAWEYSGESRAGAVYELAAKTSVETARLFGADTSAIASKRIPATEAIPFAGYLEGMACLEKNTREDLDCAVKRFKEILRADSTFIRAWEGLGECYLKNIRNRWDLNRVWLQLAQDAAFRAIRLDSTAGDARFLLARVYAQWGDMRAAELETRRSLDLNRNIADAWSLLADMAVQTRGNYDAGLEAYGRALQLSPQSSRAAAGKSLVLTGLGRYGEAAATLEAALAFHPENMDLHAILALVRLYQKKTIEAREEIKQGAVSGDSRPFYSAVLAMILASTGDLDGAVEEVTLRVEPVAGGDASLCVSVAAVYALIGRNGLSVQWLEKAMTLGYRDYVWLSNDPNFEGVRPDPRFAGLMEKVKTERLKAAGNK